MQSPMSGAPFSSPTSGGKKAVHVKWAGKTIALGTFPAAEADEKCAKAKALTRAWRSTMRPKPTREWVMIELERLGVRVVSGRLGRKAGEEGEEGESPVPDAKKNGTPVPPTLPEPSLNHMPAQRNNSLGWGMDADLSNFMARRNSSLGLSMMSDTMGRRGSLSSFGPMIGFDSEPAIPPHRPLVGGGAAAAYEAARHDHFTQRSAEQQRRASSLGLGSLANGGFGGMGMSVNPNQHYEMLKLHHMNLLNEIQETTLMMNLYQQQQLQQQQQQLEQQAGSQDLMRNNANQMSTMFPSQGLGDHSLDPMFGAAQLHRSSLGLGGAQLGGGVTTNFNDQQFQMMQQLNNMNNSISAHNALSSNVISGDNGQKPVDNRVPQLKEEIARREQVENFNRTSSGSSHSKRPLEESDSENQNKRMKSAEANSGKENNAESEKVKEEAC